MAAEAFHVRAELENEVPYIWFKKLTQGAALVSSQREDMDSLIQAVMLWADTSVPFGTTHQYVAVMRSEEYHLVIIE